MWPRQSYRSLRREGLWLACLLCCALPGLSTAAQATRNTPESFDGGSPPSEVAWLEAADQTGYPSGAFEGCAWRPMECARATWDYVRVEYLSSLLRHSSTHGRFVGSGEPLTGTSWRNRPIHIGWFVGPLFADELQAGRVAGDDALFGGYRIGWDFDHFWGMEWRIGWSNPELLYDTPPASRLTGSLMITDLNFTYYPWGDTKVRPFGSIGLGLTEADFRDDLGVRRDDTLLSVPFGLGIKHHFRRWLSWRIELMDNFALDGGTADTMHNIALTFGVEIHYGVRPRSYWPWQPSRHIW